MNSHNHEMRPQVSLTGAFVWGWRGYTETLLRAGLR